VALAAAYKALEHSFHEYRKMVVKEFGEEKDRDISRGFFPEEHKDKKSGETKVITHVNKNSHSPYAKFFDEGNANWQRDSEYNLYFLTAKQNYWNNMLHARGHVFLNEIYDDLGIPRTKAGNVVGWVISKNSDNEIDFGIYEIGSEKARQFVNGWERSILLDFNVDGPIVPNIDDI